MYEPPLTLLFPLLKETLNVNDSNNYRGNPDSFDLLLKTNNLQILDFIFVIKPKKCLRSLSADCRLTLWLGGLEFSTKKMRIVDFISLQTCVTFFTREENTLNPKRTFLKRWR